MNTENIEYNGHCAFAVSTGKTDVKTSGKSILSRNGRNYAFSNWVAKLLFRILPNRIQKADAAWKLSGQK